MPKAYSEDGYIASHTYTTGFYKEQTPAFLHYALLSGGLGPGLPAAFSSSEAFASCDIGCGFGLTPIIAAAVDPTADIWGFDFNAEHISGAKALAQAANVPNVTLLDASFETFLDHDTPDFDLITLHGIYSWVSDESRQQIIKILHKRLKPGGVVYLSYNGLTGWASAAPMRQFFYDYTNLTDSDPFAGASNAAAMVNGMRAAGAAFFGVNPQAGRLLDKALQTDARYMVHEYLNGNWSLFSLVQVADELASAGLSYAGSADLTHAFDVFHMTPEAQAMLGSIPNPLLRESARDFFMNPLLRKDIFVKDPPLTTSDRQTEALMDQRFCAMKLAGQLPQHFNFPRGGVSLTADAHAAIKTALSKGPASARTIVDNSGVELKSVLNGLKLLANVGFVAPALPEAMTAEGQQHTDRFNAALAEYEKGSGERVPFYASPITGGGISREADAALLKAFGVRV